MVAYENKGAMTATVVVAASDSLNKAAANYVCDGVADDVEIQAAINALPAGGGKVVLLEGIYNVNNRIDLCSNAVLEGSGWGTQLIVVPATFPNTASVIRLLSISNSIVKDLLIDGEWDNGRVNEDHGVELALAVSCQVENVYVKQCRGQGILTGGTSSRYCTISKCILEREEHRGINIGASARHIVISDCIAIDCKLSSFLVGSAGIESMYIEFVNCIGIHLLDDNTSADFFIAVGCHHCKLTNCISYNSHNYGFALGGDYCQAVNCESYKSYGHGISVTGTSCSVIGCIARFSRNNSNGITVASGSGIIVDGCTVVYNELNGIRVVDCSYFKISNNICKNNSQAAIGVNTGIELIKSASYMYYGQVIGNQCYDDQDSVSSLLTTDANLGQADVIVANASLFFEGQWVTISDDTPDTENNQVDSINITTNTLTMVNNLTANYTVAQNAVVTGRKTQGYGLHDGTNSIDGYHIIKNNILIGNITQGIISTVAAGRQREYQFDEQIQTISLDLSGGAIDIPVYTAMSPSRLMGYRIVYSEASSADAGVAINIGRISSAGVVANQYYDTTVSEASKAIGYSTMKSFTDLTNSDISLGSTITVGTAGGKVGTGEVRLILQIAEMTD